MQSLKLKVRQSYYVRLAIVSALTAGIGLLVMLFEYLRWAREFDATGVTRRDGRRFEWKDLKEKRYIHMRVSGGQGPLNHIELLFTNGKATVFPFTLENAGEVMDYVKKIPA